MANKQDYLATLRAAIWTMHSCGAVWRETVRVDETFQGETIFNGDVEVFDLMQHPKAKRAYAWAEHEGSDGGGGARLVAVLELPPVTDAQTAVRASIMADLKKGQS